MINPRVHITPIEVKLEPGICCVLGGKLIQPTWILNG